MHDIWVYCELLENNQPSPASLELLGKARQLLAERPGQAAALLLGRNCGEAAARLLSCGAQKVIMVDAPALQVYSPRPYATVLEKLARKYQPNVLLLAATCQGRDLAPRVQARLRTGLTADCLDLELDEQGLLLQTKPAYGDNLMCAIVCPTLRPQMATVRPGVFGAPLENLPGDGVVVEEKFSVAPDPDYEVLQHRPLPRGDDISHAEVIIALGQGAASDRALKAAEQLAARLQGKVAVTRPLGDSRKFPHEMVIGQSGAAVKPKFILNCGISGAIQYRVGIREAGLIMAVNRDAEAAIFEAAHYGVLGDAGQIMEALLEELYNNEII